MQYLSMIVNVFLVIFLIFLTISRNNIIEEKTIYKIINEELLTHYDKKTLTDFKVLSNDGLTIKESGLIIKKIRVEANRK